MLPRALKLRILSVSALVAVESRRWRVVPEEEDTDGLGEPRSSKVGSLGPVDRPSNKDLVGPLNNSNVREIRNSAQGETLPGLRPHRVRG